MEGESQLAVSATPLQWRLLSYLPLALGFAALVAGLWGLAFPPFSDAEIAANLVDTWEASALGSLVLIVLESVGVVISGGLLWVARSGARQSGKRFMFAALCFLVGIACTLVSQHLLTIRAERLTGHDLSWLW